METFDCVGGIGLTLSAVVLAGVLTQVIGNGWAQRLKLASVLAGWFVIVVILGATRALDPEQGIGAPGLGLAVAVPIIAMWLALMRIPSIRKALDAAPLAVLVGAHAVRLLGIDFLLLHAAHRLPAPFAPVAGWGDIVAGIAAVPVAWMVYRQIHGWRSALIAWNLFGLADLAAAIGLGVLSSPGPLHLISVGNGSSLMTTLPWLLIPGFVVPLLVTTHLAIFYRLAMRAQRAANPRAILVPE